MIIRNFSIKIKNISIFCVIIFLYSCTPSFYAKDGMAFHTQDLANKRNKLLKRIENYRMEVKLLNDKDFEEFATRLSIKISYTQLKEFKDTNFIPFKMVEGIDNIAYYETALQDFLASKTNYEDKSIIMNLYINSNICLKEDIGLFKITKDLDTLISFYAHLQYKYETFSDIKDIELLEQSYKEEHFIDSPVIDYQLVAKKYEYLSAQSYGLQDSSIGVIKNTTKYLTISEFSNIDDDLFDELFEKNLNCYYKYEKEIKKIYKQQERS